MNELIERINTFTALAKQRELTEAEQQQRQQLRAEYMQAFKANFRQQLDSTYVQDEDGGKVPLKDWHEQQRKDAEQAFTDKE